MVLEKEGLIEGILFSVLIVIAIYNQVVQFVTDVYGSINLIKLVVILLLGVSVVIRTKLMKKFAFG